LEEGVINFRRRGSFCLISLLLLVPLSWSQTRPERRPNFILIIADDMAWDDYGAYGHRTIKTPNLDRLARQGMRFDRAFLTASSCSPSRASLITGRYPHSVDAEQLHWPLPKEQITFVELLRKAGYWTAAAGKWHLGDDVKDRFDQVREADPAGFQLGTGGGLAVKSAVGAVQSGCDQWLPTLRARPRGRPFFLWLASLDPHRDYQENAIPHPHRPADVVVPPYLPDIAEVRTELALYYDEISRLDRYVAEVLTELDRQGEAEHTLVLFMSDNGRPFPRAKTTTYDSGIKTPWVVRWLARVKPGSVSGSLVSAIDIAPTFVELAGIVPPAGFQGKSFARLLEDPQRAIHDYVYAEDNWHDYADHARAVRSLQYKYIRNYYDDLPGTPGADAVRSLTFLAMLRLRAAGALSIEQSNVFARPRPREELYDTAADPHELRNLVEDARYAGTLAEMRKVLLSWERETGDRVPRIRTPDEFDRETGAPLPNRKRPRPSKKELGL
jgi:N-sulfoglucosamine sulfohydrolase